MNTTDITNMNDKVLDAFLTVKATGEASCEGLSVKERYTLAEALGWDVNSYSVQSWCRGQ